MTELRMSNVACRIKCLLVVLGISGSSAVSAWGASAMDAQGEFYRGNAQYQAGHYDEAASAYQAALNDGWESGPLYYNLGNAFLKSGHHGSALWAYLHAQQLLPQDPDVRANLAYTQALLPAGAETSPQYPRVVEWLMLGGYFSIRNLLLASLIGLWVCCGMWIGTSWIPNPPALLRGTAWMATLVTAVFGIALATQTLWTEERPQGVVVAASGVARFSPQENGTVHFTVPEGAVVRVVFEQPGWTQIQRHDGRTGWITSDAVKTL